MTLAQNKKVYKFCANVIRTRRWKPCFQNRLYAIKLYWFFLSLKFKLKDVYNDICGIPQFSRGKSLGYFLHTFNPTSGYYIFVSGIFPEKLKLSKIKLVFKKKQ